MTELQPLADRVEIAAPPGAIRVDGDTATGRAHLEEYSPGGPA